MCDFFFPFQALPPCLSLLWRQFWQSTCFLEKEEGVVNSTERERRISACSNVLASAIASLSHAGKGKPHTHFHLKYPCKPKCAYREVNPIVLLGPCYFLLSVPWIRCVFLLFPLGLSVNVLPCETADHLKPYTGHFKACKTVQTTE